MRSSVRLRPSPIHVAALVGCLAGTVHADPASIHGTIELADGKEVTGLIRWEHEQGYWLHSFRAMHAAPPDLSALSEDDREAIIDQQPGPQIRLDSGTVIELAKWLGDQEMAPTEFETTFAQMERLENDGAIARLTLRDGTELELDATDSWDLGGDITVIESGGVDDRLDWDEIAAIRFHEGAPGTEEGEQAGFDDYVYGRVSTPAGAFEGLVEWDAGGGAPAERLKSSKIDGDEPDGDEISVPFGDVTFIENRGDASLVRIRGGREYLLDDSNDVNERNSGLIVYDPRYGRVRIYWQAFQTLETLPIPEGYLPGRDQALASGPLKGRVTTTDGATADGTLMFDVDERRAADVISGRADDIEYFIPLHQVVSIVRAEKDSTVVLDGGIDLQLGMTRDLGPDNNGIVVTANDGQSRYILWENVKRLDIATD